MTRRLHRSALIAVLAVVAPALPGCGDDEPSPAAGCSGPADCDPGSTCAAGSCVGIGCTDDDGCPAGSHCGDADACVPGAAEGEGEGGDRLCVPGRSETCACEDGHAGAQVCNEDGMGYGECRCQGSPGEGEGEGGGEGEGEGGGEGEGEGGGEGEGEGGEGEGEGGAVGAVGTPCDLGADPCPEDDAPECIDTGGVPYCSRTCGGDGECPDSFCCQEIDGGGSYCVPDRLCADPGGCEGDADCPDRWPTCVLGRCHGDAGPGATCDGGFQDCDPLGSTSCVVDPLLGEAVCSSPCDPNDDACGAGRCCADTVGEAAPADFYCVVGEARCQAPDCDNDDLEPNQNREGAPDLAAGIVNLAICPNDEDWLAVTLRDGETLRVAISYAVDVAQGDILLELRDDGGALLAAGEGPDGAESLALLSPAGGRYFLRVRSSSREDARVYRLEVLIGCEGRDDCPGRQTCGPAGRCEDGFPCLGDQDCVGAKQCNGDTNRCQLDCVDDGEEDNDGSDEATRVQPGELGDLTICPDDEDWFEVGLQRGQGLEARIDFLNAVGDLDLEVYAPGGERRLASSAGTEDFEVARVEVAEQDGAHLVRVYGFGGETGDYDLTLTVAADGFCRDDDFEDDDVAARATVLDGPGTVEDVKGCGGDDDWFALQVGARDTLTASIDFAHRDGNLDLEVVGPDGREVLGASRSASDDESVEVQAAAAGVHYVHVVAAAGADAAYTLTTEVERFRPPCNDDGREPDDEAGDATRLQSGQGVDGSWSCPEDPDYFVIRVDRGAAIAGHLTFDGADGNLDLTLFAPDGLFLDKGDAVQGDSEDVAVGLAPETGDYVLVVDSPDLVAVEYALVVEVDNEGVCVDDGSEDNDRAGAADPIGAGTHGDLQLCDGDDDWYRIDKAGPAALFVDLFFSDSEGDLQLALYDATGADLLLSSTSNSDNEHVNTLGLIQHMDEPAYLVRVYGAVGEQASYSLGVTVVPPAGGCVDDDYEPNETVLYGTPAEPGTLEALQLCPGSSDFFRVQVDAGQTLTASIDLDNSGGNLDLELYGPSGLDLEDTDDGPDDTERVSAGPVAASGVWTVRVVGANPGAQNDYTLTVQVE